MAFTVTADHRKNRRRPKMDKYFDHTRELKKKNGEHVSDDNSNCRRNGH